MLQFPDVNIIEILGQMCYPESDVLDLFVLGLQNQSQSRRILKNTVSEHCTLVNVVDSVVCENKFEAICGSFNWVNSPSEIKQVWSLIYSRTMVLRENSRSKKAFISDFQKKSLVFYFQIIPMVKKY